MDTVCDLEDASSGEGVPLFRLPPDHRHYEVYLLLGWLTLRLLLDGILARMQGEPIEWVARQHLSLWFVAIFVVSGRWR